MPYGDAFWNEGHLHRKARAHQVLQFWPILSKGSGSGGAWRSWALSIYWVRGWSVLEPSPHKSPTLQPLPRSQPHGPCECLEQVLRLLLLLTVAWSPLPDVEPKPMLGALSFILAQGPGKAKSGTAFILT